jgi:hypothetical protein
VSDESADRSGKPHRYYFDDLADSEEFAEPAGDLVDTGPIQVIRDPLPGSAAGQQLYFDDVDPEPEVVPDDEPEPLYAPAAPLGDEPPRRGILAGSGARRPRPIGAILAVVAVLALIGVIAAVGGQGHKGHKAKQTGSSHTNAALSTPKPSQAAGPTQAPSQRSSSTTPSKKPAQRHRPATKTPTDIPLTVLNNTIKSGLAAQAAQLFSTKGWKVGPPGNYTGDLSATTVYYDPSSSSQHKAAETLAAQFPQVAQVQPRFAGLPGSGLTVVLAPDWP